MDTVSIDLGYLPPMGQISLISADWWEETSRFVVFRYAVDRQTRELGIAMDLDKGVILDSVGDDRADLALRQCSETLWKIALEARRMVGLKMQPVEVGLTRRRAWTVMMESALEQHETAPGMTMF